MKKTVRMSTEGRLPTGKDRNPNNSHHQTARTDHSETSVSQMVQRPEKQEKTARMSTGGRLPRLATRIPKKRANNRKSSKKGTFSIYIYRVLKQIHPETGCSSKAISVLNSFMNDAFEKIASEASLLAKRSQKTTISSRDIQSAVRLVLPGELAAHAVYEGSKAMDEYEKNK